jgi:hypothetical protein
MKLQPQELNEVRNGNVEKNYVHNTTTDSMVAYRQKWLGNIPRIS